METYRDKAFSAYPEQLAKRWIHMKNRTRKIIITLLAVIALLIGIMPFENRKVEAATTQIVWEKDDVKNVYVDTRKSDHLSYSKDGITIAAEAESNGQRCLFHDRLIDITSGKIVFSCDSSKGRISQLEIICGEAKNFARDDESWSSSYSEGETHLVWKGQGNPEIVFHPSEYDEDPYMLNIQYVEKMIFTLVSEDTEYPLWVGSRQVTSAYLSNEEEGWSYDPETKTLTLENANITGSSDASYGSCIYIGFMRDATLNINLIGENKVGSENAWYGIYDVITPTMITGDGSLTVSDVTDTGISGGGSTITIKDTTVTVKNCNDGIFSNRNLQIDNSTVTVSANDDGIEYGDYVMITDSKVDVKSKNTGLLCNHIYIYGNSYVSADTTDSGAKAAGYAMVSSEGDFKLDGVEIIEPEEGKIENAIIEGFSREPYYFVFDKDDKVAPKAIIAKTYLITFKNDDGTVLQEKKTPVYETPKYEGNTPTKESDDEYDYTFKGWDKEITEVKGDATYTAVYDKTPIETPEPEPKPVTPFSIPKTGVE
ncbi:MAG: carbohydrate-binding domain-containing protein [Erysipelotrichaceae bacterium]|nr:carbohydrate-binding domain-containing protein [Erysipelotrichaceae bacterium]